MYNKHKLNNYSSVIYIISTILFFIVLLYSYSVGKSDARETDQKLESVIKK